MPRAHLDRDFTADILDRYFKVTTPIFDKAMAERFAIERRNLKLSQKQMADKFGLTQTTISRLESGKIDHIPVTTEKFRIVFGKGFDYVLSAIGYWHHEQLNWQYDKRKGAWVASRVLKNRV